MYISRLAIELNKTDLKRKKLEDDLINKNLRLLEFNKSLSSATILVVTDEKGIIKYVSDSFCEISQYSREEIIGNNHRIMKSGYHNAEFFENMWKTITAGKIFTGEIKNKAKDGSYYWAHSTIIPLKNKKDIITGFIAIRQNITERKERELLKEK